ncbi:ABC transporter ATP-binding protein [Actinobacteria bacterium YIM 96077]|uniref:ABC transporter ATP-binding protein n=1 Tax=Phytoactinopolyspora halophila TaxID=1981511 RepID=A0A329QAW3_9ACTN|nr:ABC transporter ATP-binding protein [Phytoactinopolyspora halophila]AYY15545.1 ABC transporter ATP-binding protein [Actinobacteria bacterium YIM 96077]RAW09486.1 ABC transporter ATP-binding protein [Phytoactinopolyspora halophila]
MADVTLEGVTKVFDGGTTALDNVSLDVADGEFMVLLGPSGCGKSTLLRIVAGLDDPTRGTVYLDGEPTDGLAPRDRGIAMVFQDYALYPHMNVGDNIGFPLKMAGIEPEERERRTSDAASALGIADILGRRTQRLSGGQRQRVAMGRAIVREPDLFLMDEPLSNLDAGQRAELRNEIGGLAQQLGVTVIYVTHDQTEALTMADRVAILRRGVLQDVGTPAAVYNRPATIYVASFLGNPRICLAVAKVDAHEGSHIELHIGEQTLSLPWAHSRTRILSRYDNERIIVGIRAEALTPVTPGTASNELAGKVRTLEHHGHETLAFLDIRASAIAPDEVGTTKAEQVLGNRWRRPFGSWASRWSRNGGRSDDETTSTADGETPGRHLRRSAEVAVRLAPYPHIKTGEPLSVAVDTEALLFFNDRGNRIDVVGR